MTNTTWTPDEMDALREVLAERDARIAELEQQLQQTKELLHAEANNFETVSADSNRIVEIGIARAAENERLKTELHRAATRTGFGKPNQHRTHHRTRGGANE